MKNLRLILFYKFGEEKSVECFLETIRQTLEEYDITDDLFNFSIECEYGIVTGNNEFHMKKTKEQDGINHTMVLTVSSEKQSYRLSISYYFDSMDNIIVTNVDFVPIDKSNCKKIGKKD